MRAQRCIVRWLAAAVATAAAGCGSSDKFHWQIVSNPGGSFGPDGGAVIVIRKRSDTSGLDAPGGPTLTVRGVDSKGDVTVHLPTGADVAVLERPDGVELRSPALPRGIVELAGARVGARASATFALAIELPDAGAVDRHAAHGPGRLHAARGGTLLVLEHLDGVVVFASGARVQAFPAGTRLDPAGEPPLLRLPDGRVRALHPPPHPAPEQRIARGPVAGSVRLFGPAGGTVAILPEDRVELHGGAFGLFLTAAFPEGLDERDPVPMALTMAEHNRYLLRVDASAAR